MTPIEWLEHHGVLSERTLCIHVVQVTDADLDRLARANASIAHCPLSNLAHGHGSAPLAGFLMRGLRVGLGTDSVMSVGALDLLAEARQARRSADLGARQALELATVQGARCLGREAEIGSLEPGKLADVALWRVDDLAHAGISDPVAALVFGLAPRVELLLVGGVPVVRGAELETTDEGEISREIAGASRRLAERAEEVAL
jgi:cytosine/adenosine deaminase-related metal-dependent hydrolase